MRDVDIAMDTRADVENYKENGTIIVNCQTIEFNIIITKLLSTNTITGVFEGASLPTNAMGVQWYPKDRYMQIIASFV